MTTPIVINDKEFNFDGIFPNCMQDLRIYKKIKEDDYSDILMNPCFNIFKELGGQQINRYDFLRHCKELILYLNYINTIKSSPNKKPSCVYFNYMVKNTLKYFKISDQNSYHAYDKIIDHTKNTVFNSVSNVCKNDFNEMDENIYLTLTKLNVLYEWISEPGMNCSKSEDCNNVYKELSDIRDRSNNESLRKALENFENAYMTYLPYLQELLKLRASLKNERIVMLAFIIIPVTLLMITFFLYKYTPHGSFLQRSVRKLRRIWNKKNNDYLNIKDSFVLTYNSLIDDKY
ncbi:variable surface protein [Plasmodium gonderi]|uniref:Variable surface protein n=1 Tax=Plasmodium gonderi TaxID=77519 RepID=A0A1Y1JWH8_PLAGO|nr:variable surface protein [Plasmodium gonderi]GAW84204.1 variable surface protein [Plasmodium gonderi]